MDVGLVQMMRRQGEVALSALREGQLRERVAQVTIELDPIGLRRLDQAVQGGAGVCAAGRTAEQPILATNHKRADRILHGVGIGSEIRAVLQR